MADYHPVTGERGLISWDVADLRDRPTFWWGIFSVFAFLTGIALLGVVELDGFAAGVSATLACLFFLCAGGGVYLAVAAHRGTGPFREPPPPAPVVKPSVQLLAETLHQM